MSDTWKKANEETELPAKAMLTGFDSAVVPASTAHSNTSVYDTKLIASDTMASSTGRRRIPAHADEVIGK